jgi:hypothetical protein
MTRDEKAAVLQGKAATLIKSFEGRTLPAVPFKLKPWATILDVQKYVSTNMAVLGGTDNPFSRPYVAAYLRLNDLKIYIDELSKIDSQPGPV